MSQLNARPNFSQSKNKEIQELQEYCMTLYRQLQMVLLNLDTSNFSQDVADKIDSVSAIQAQQEVTTNAYEGLVIRHNEEGANMVLRPYGIQCNPTLISGTYEDKSQIALFGIDPMDYNGPYLALSKVKYNDVWQGVTVSADQGICCLPTYGKSKYGTTKKPVYVDEFGWFCTED